MMKKNFQILVSGILSGVLIGIGGTAFLLTKSTSAALGSFLFSIGLTIIILFKLHLFTGKIGYAFEENNKSYWLLLLLTYLGNFIGAAGMGYVLRLTRIDIDSVANTVSDIKLNDNILSLFILGFMCGIMIYLAVEVQRYDFHPVFKLFAIVLAIMVFILCGFEHCIADMFYFSAANAWSLKALLYILIISIGNGLGSIFFWLLLRFYQNKIQKKQSN